MERRAKHINMTSYYPIPADDELSTAIFLHCGHHTSEVRNESLHVMSKEV